MQQTEHHWGDNPAKNYKNFKARGLCGDYSLNYGCQLQCTIKNTADARVVSFVPKRSEAANDATWEKSHVIVLLMYYGIYRIFCKQYMCNSITKCFFTKTSKSSFYSLIMNFFHCTPYSLYILGSLSLIQNHSLKTCQSIISWSEHNPLNLKKGQHQISPNRL